MSIRDWPTEERPREKLLRLGPGSLSDSELLAIFLRTGIKGKSALDLARGLLVEFGSLRGLFDAQVEDFQKIKGLGPAKFVQFQAALEVARRYLSQHLERSEVLSSPQITRDYLISRLRGLSREVFVCLLLDSQNRLIECHELFWGTIDSAAVYPREVVALVLKYQAAGVIFAHNHPSGVAEPSQADRLITDRLKKALDLVDVRVLDHFIIGEGELVSFAERGWL